MSHERGSENRDFISNFVHALFVEAPAAALAWIKSLAGVQTGKKIH